MTADDAYLLYIQICRTEQGLGFSDDVFPDVLKGCMSRQVLDYH